MHVERDEVEGPFVEQLTAMGWTRVPGTEIGTLDADAPLLVDKPGAALRRINVRAADEESRGWTTGVGERGRMTPGWPLFQLPMHLVDYVVAHELAHTKVSGHRADFWRLVCLALPEYEERRAELDELGRRMWMGEIC